MDYNDKTTIYIYEVGLYRLMFRSKNKQSVDFTARVCSEVPPSNRKHGAHISKEKVIESFGMIHNDEAEALPLTNNPRGRLNCIMMW